MQTDCMYVLNLELHVGNATTLCVYRDTCIYIYASSVVH